MNIANKRNGCLIKNVSVKISLTLLLLLSIPGFSFSQKSDSLKVANTFNTTITVTNKGISSIPNLTLGKPAAIIVMTMGRKLKFEPEFRFSLEGKPWMFIFWGRYDFLNNDKSLIKLRANPTVIFKTLSVTTNNVTTDIQRATRTLTADLTTSFHLTKKFAIGGYYMYVYGVEKDIVKNTHYIALRTSLSNLMLSKEIYMGFNPAVYYLKMDKNHGFYSNATLTFAKKNFPLSLAALVNKTIHTEIPVGENFLWNLSLIYTINKKYVEQK